MKGLIKWGMLLAMMVALVPAFGQQSARFGHVDFNAIVEAMPETKAADEAVEKRSEELKARLEQIYNELEALFQQYQERAATYSAQVREAKQKEITDKQEQLAKEEESADTSLEELWNTRMEAVYEKVNRAIQEVAKERAYLYIFDSRSIRYAAQPSDDITALVKKKLGIS